MYIACTENCIHQKEGLCTKEDCRAQNEYISGSFVCPHFLPKKKDDRSSINKLDEVENTP